jgi:uncharacterized RDD family membrane protein YckC
MSLAKRPGAIPPEGVSGSNAPAQPYGGFWLRGGAYLIDYFVLLVLAIPGALLAVVSPYLGVALVFVEVWLYEAIMTSSRAGATLGKLALGVQVLRVEDGGRISFRRASLRYFVKLVSWLTLGIVFLMIGLNRRRLGLHDVVARTVVVKKHAIAVVYPAAHVT